MCSRSQQEWIPLKFLIQIAIFDKNGSEDSWKTGEHLWMKKSTLVQWNIVWNARGCWLPVEPLGLTEPGLEGDCWKYRSISHSFFRIMSKAMTVSAQQYSSYQSMWISNAPLMLQVKEMRVGQMGWGLENQRSGHWAGSSALPLSKLEYCIFSSNILHTVQYNQMTYIEVEYASVITGKRCWRHDGEPELWCGGMDPGRMC